MDIHEFQAKTLLRKYGIPVPPFVVAMNEEEVIQGIKELGLTSGVVKIQVHAGGRKKAGGVQFAKDSDEIVRYANALLGMKIVNNQTGPAGVVTQKVLITPTVSIKKEYYLAITIDRQKALPMLICSAEGGVDIEELAERNPERILKIPLRSDGNIREFQLLRIAKFMHWEGDIRKQAYALIGTLSRLFMDIDASLIEINPLVLTEDQNLLALDAKITIDDSALYRQPPIAQWYDPSQIIPSEAMAKQYGLSYVGLEGDIGCMVNGAGLAMATMDIIHTSGGKPANFLDVGGGASKEAVSQGFKIILSDKRVKVIFVNIFGGIMDCGVLAQGIVDASKEDQVAVPLVVRMEGTNVETGKRILKESGLNLITADTMAEGAQKAVEVARGA